jgi:transposase
MSAQRVCRDLKALERRRKQAARLFAQGHLVQASVARQLQVSRISVSRWYRQWKKSGSAAWNAALRAGRKPLLHPRPWPRVPAALRRGAWANGFRTELWTLPGVAAVSERISGVRYHPGHVWKILGARNWSAQKPEKQAQERKADQVADGKTVR